MENHPMIMILTFHVSYKIKRIITIFSMHLYKKIYWFTFTDRRRRRKQGRRPYTTRSLYFAKTANCVFYINCFQHITIGDVDLK